METDEPVCTNDAPKPGSVLFDLFASAANQIADFIVPPVCLSCQDPLASHNGLCARCWRDIHFIRPPLCDVLGTPMPFDTGAKTVSGAALANPPDYDRARAVAAFDGEMRTLVHRYKYADRHDARDLFARWLHNAGAELLADAELLVPVPLNRWRLLTRRFNQAALLARDLGKRVGVPVDPFVLSRIKPTKSQVGLTMAERRRNIAGAFKVRGRKNHVVSGKRIVLIDDVITTGATASACAKVLKAAGAARVDVLALALVTDDSRIVL